MLNERLKRFSNKWLLEATIDDLNDKLDTNEITSYELVLMYLDRISAYDQSGPKINSVLEVNPEALHIAAALDRERKQKGPRSPLHGIPVLLKDNINTKDKMHTSAGSLALKDSYAHEDAFLVNCFRKAGAIILGKTNMTEWANFMTEGMPNGFSSRGGQVLNPYGPGSLDVGGSSAGSGAAIAANFASVAIGTETSGSILSPASQNSLVGIKPTVGLISRSGIIPISHSQDTAGPMTRCVKDAAYVLNAITASDEADPITLTNEDTTVDYTTCLNADGLKNKNVGVARDVYFEYLSDEKKEILEQAIEAINRLGGVTKDVQIPTTKAEWDYNVLVYEFKSDLNAYLKTVDPALNIRSLKDVIAFNAANETSALKYGQTLLLEAEETSGTLTDSTYLNSLEKDVYLSREAGLDLLFKEQELDVIVFPNNFGASIPAKAGYPSITVPAGYTKEGEPVGITFTSKAYNEATLLAIAYAYEQGTKMRKAPNIEEVK